MSLVFAVAAMGMPAVLPDSAFAALVDTYWKAGTGDYFDPNNWTEGLPAHSATIANGGTAQITYSGTASTYVYVGNFPPGSSGHVEVTGGDGVDTIHGDLGVVALLERAAAVLHDPALRIREVLLVLRLRLAKRILA